jgi:hypothetical protein
MERRGGRGTFFLLIIRFKGKGGVGKEDVMET